MYADKNDFPEFLRLLPYPTTPCSSGASAISTTSAVCVPEAEELVKYTSFVPWETIDQNAVSCGTALQKHFTSEQSRFPSGIQDLNGRMQSALFTNAATAASEFNSLIECVSSAMQIREIRDELTCQWRAVLSCTGCGFSCSDHAMTLKNRNMIWNEEKGDMEAACACVTLPKTRIIKPDITLRDAERQDELSILNVVGKRPTLTIGKILERNAASQPTLHGQIQVLLQRVRDNVAELCEDEQVLWLSISQALVYALHTESGISILTNFNETIFIRLCEAKLETIAETNTLTPKLEVAVSRIYDGNSVFCGLAACLQYIWSLDVQSNVDWENRTRFIERLILEYDCEEPLTGKKSLTDSGNIEAQKKMRTGISHTAQASGTINIHPANDKAEEASSSGIRQSHSKELSRQVLHELVSRNGEMICKHGYNRVLKSQLGERPVAIKYFYTFEDKRIESLISREKNIYLLMETKSNGEYGDYVSALLGYGTLKAFGMMLVTAYVGQRVRRSISDVFVGGSKIEDAELLSEAAVASLKRVHKLGVIHGDVELRNMRAEQRANGEWHIWWIDFGQSMESANLSAFAREVRRCRHLFQRGNGPGKD